MGWLDQIDNTHIVLSSEAKRFANGSVELEQASKPIFDREGRQVGVLTPAAARSWNAMVAAAAKEKVDLRPTSPHDTFRPLAVQKRIRAQRYHPCATGKLCHGVRQCLNAGEKAAACPGFSNHGNAAAVDFRRHQPNILPWMELNAKRFGWQWELDTEEWHVHYMLGDQLTEVVLDVEGDQSPEEDDDMPFILFRTANGEKYLVVGNKRVALDDAGVEVHRKAGAKTISVDEKAYDAYEAATEKVG